MGLADDLTGEAQTATKKQLEKPVYMWSTNQENYHGHKCETEWEAIMDAVRDEDLQHGDTVFVSRMRKLEMPAFEEFMHADYILESANEWFADNEGPEDSIINVSNERNESLMDALGKTWQEWVKKNPGVIDTFYQALNPQKIEIDHEHLEEKH